MKALGVKQFHQMKHKLLEILDSAFAKVLGKVPTAFILVIYGYSGNGKTEFTLKLAKTLALIKKKVGWISYEQRHGYDLQLACKRNKMEEVNKSFILIDPIANKDDNKTFLEDIDDYLCNPKTGRIKRNAPDVIVIDSVDYTGWSWKDYAYLKEKYGNRIIFILIAHSSPTGRLFKDICRRILFDGGAGIFVSNYIAHRTEKNRFGGTEDYVIWEEEARKRNPAFFAKQVKESKPSKKDTSETLAPAKESDQTELKLVKS